MRKGSPQRLGKIIRSVLSERGYLSTYYEAEIIQKWPSIVGEKISKITKCTELKDDIVYVHVFSASWRQEIYYLKKEIIKKIKKETRCNTIKDIVFY